MDVRCGCGDQAKPKKSKPRPINKIEQSGYNNTYRGPVAGCGSCGTQKRQSAIKSTLFVMDRVFEFFRPTTTSSASFLSSSWLTFHQTEQNLVHVPEVLHTRYMLVYLVLVAIIIAVTQRLFGYLLLQKLICSASPNRSVSIFIYFVLSPASLRVKCCVLSVVLR